MSRPRISLVVASLVVERGPVVIHRPKRRLARRPRLALLPRGGVIAAWESVDTHSGGGTYESMVYAAPIKRSGAAGKPIAVSRRGGHSFFPDVATDPRGRASVIWQRGRRVELARLDRHLRPGRPIRLDDRSGGYPNDPHVAVDRYGRATASWSYCCGSRIEVDAVRVSSAQHPHRPARAYSGAEDIDSSPLIVDNGVFPLLLWGLRYSGVQTSIGSS